MIKFTVTTPMPLPPTPDDAMATTHFERDPFEESMLKLGELLTHKEEATEWMPIRRIGRLCQKYWSQLPRLSFRTEDLKLKAMDYFEKRWEMCGGGIKVAYKTEWGGKSGSQAYIRFSKVDPAHLSPEAWKAANQPI
jgi:hypothetical protein